MSIDIEVIDRNPQHVLQVSVETSMLKIPKTLARCFSSVTQHMKSIGATKADAPFSQYLDLDWEFVRTGSTFAQFRQLIMHKQKLEVGIPVSAKVQGEGEVAYAEVPGGRFVEALHIGAYHKLGKTYKQVAEWAFQNGISLSNKAFESYTSDPGDVPTDKLETHIYVRIND